MAQTIIQIKELVSVSPDVFADIIPAQCQNATNATNATNADNVIVPTITGNDYGKFLVDANGNITAQSTYGNVNAQIQLVQTLWEGNQVITSAGGDITLTTNITLGDVLCIYSIAEITSSQAGTMPTTQFIATTIRIDALDTTYNKVVRFVSNSEGSGQYSYIDTFVQFSATALNSLHFSGTMFASPVAPIAQNHTILKITKII